MQIRCVGKKLYLANNGQSQRVTPRQAYKRILLGDCNRIAMSHHQIKGDTKELFAEILDIEDTGAISVEAIIGVDNKTPHIGMRRALAGPTRAVFEYLFEDVEDAQAVDDVDTLVGHPAVYAMRYLENNGAHVPSLLTFVQRLGDIRRPLLGYRAESNKRPAAYVLERHSDFSPRVCSFVSQAMLQEAQLYRQRGSTDNLLLKATLGRWANLTADDPNLFQSVINRHVNLDIGVCYAAMLGVQIIINEWIAKEFHPDFFDDSVFNDGNKTKHRLMEYRGIAST